MKRQEALMCSAEALVNNCGDKFEIFGAYIGKQLQGMTREQQEIAQKITSEVMFYGNLGKLTINATLLLEGHSPK